MTNTFENIITAAVQRETETRDRAWAARDRVATLRAQLAAAEENLSSAERDSQSAQQFLVTVWTDFREVGIKVQNAVWAGASAALILEGDDK